MPFLFHLFFIPVCLEYEFDCCFLRSEIINKTKSLETEKRKKNMTKAANSAYEEAQKHSKIVRKILIV